MKTFSSILRTVSAACLPMILACAAAVQANAAQKNIAEGLITTSEGGTETWYYIEVPYSSQASPIGSIVNDHAGRGFTVLTTMGSSTTAQFKPLYPNHKRGDQQWKVVAADNDSYYLVNKNGKYLNSLVEGSEGTKYTITKMNDYFVKVLSNGSAALGADPNSTNARYDGNPTHTGIHSATGLPTDGNPGLRTLRFVPVAQLDGQYPHIYPNGTAVNNVMQWFFVKSLDASKSAAPYLTMSDGGETLELAANNDQNFTKQLFGFVSSDDDDDDDEKTSIICYTAQDKYLNIDGSALKLMSADKGWILRHVIAPGKNTSQIQGVIRDTRGTAASTTSGGNIITSNMTTATWSNTYSTYDNEYTWAYEKAYMVTVSESDDKVSELTATSPAATVTGIDTYSIMSKSSIDEVKFTVKVSENHVPTVVVNGMQLSQDAVIQGNNGGGYCEYTVTVNPTEVLTNIVVSTPTTVTVNENQKIFITSPANLAFDTPTDVAKGSIFTLQFTLNDGYHTPRVKVNDTYNPAVAASESNGTYTLTLPNVSDDKTISISALPPTELLAKEDTYVDERGKTTDHKGDVSLLVQHGTGDYVRRAYMSFEPSDYLKNNVYNKAELKLRYLNRENKANKENKIGVFTVANNVTVNSMTWTANSEQRGTISGEQISDWVVINYPLTTPQDVPDILLGDTVIKQLSNNTIRLQLAATPDFGSIYSDGNLYFASRENATDLYYAPRLVFSQVPSNVAITYNTAVSNVKVIRKGDNDEVSVTSSSHDYEALFDTTITITFDVTSGYAAQLTLDGVRRDALLEKINETQYSLTLSHILTPKTVEINAIEPVEFTVIETASGSVTVTEPNHLEINEPEKVAKDDPFTLKFKVNEGYELTSVTVGSETLTLTPDNDIYTLEIESATHDTTITINAPLRQLSVDFTTGKDEHVTWVGSPAANVDYFSDYECQFTLSDGYHTPRVKVNDTYNLTVAASEQDGTYTLTLADVRENKAIVISALPPTELLAKEDTYVDGRSTTADNKGGVSLLVQHGEGSYVRRAYMSFEPSDYLKSNVYNKAELKLRYLNREDKANKNHKMAVFTAASNVAVNSMTWNANSEQQGTISGTQISDWVTISYPYSTSQDGPDILLGDTVIKQLSNTAIRLQLADTIYYLGTSNSDGYIYFASRENTADLYYAPRLVFSQVPSDVTINYNAAVSNVKIARQGESDEDTPSSPHTYSAPCDATITITFDVTDGSAVQLTLDGARQDVLLTPNGSNKYSLTLPNILKPKTVEINAIEPVEFTVTEAANGSVTVTEPNHLEINKPEKVAKDEPFTLKFKVNEGYTFTNVQVGSETINDLTPNSNGVYTLTIGSATQDATITINAPLNVYSVSSVTVGYGVVVTETPAATAEHGKCFEVKVTKETPEYSFKVKLNGQPYTPEIINLGNNAYKLCICITSDSSTVEVREGLPDIAIEVTADTYVGNGSEVNAKNDENVNLMVRYSGGDYYRVAYLMFRTSGGQKLKDVVAGYNTGKLRLVTNAANESATGDYTYLEARTVPDELGPVNDMTWNGNGEAARQPKGVLIDTLYLPNTGFAANTVMELDVLSYLSTVDRDSVRLIVSSTGPWQSYVRLYSKEGATDENAGKAPRLIIEQQPVSIALAIDDNVTLESSGNAAVGDNVVDYGKTFVVSFRLANGATLPVVTVNGKEIAAPSPVDGLYTVFISTSELKGATAAVNIRGITPRYVTVDIPLADAAIMLITPSLSDGNKFRVEDGATFKVTANLKAGYGFTSAILGTEDITYNTSMVSRYGSAYWIVTIPNVTADATLTLAIDTLTRTITVKKQAGITNVNAPASVKHFTEARITFELAAGYHLPQAWVGTGYRAVTGNGNPSYTLSIPNVTANQTVTLWAYPDTVAPVTEDTYIASGSSNNNINYVKGDTLVVEQTEALENYLRRAYLKFDIPDSITSRGYNYAALQLYVKEVEKSNKTKPNRIEVRTTPADIDFPAVTWSNSGNTALAPNGALLAQSEDIPLTAADTLITLDISDHYMDAADPTTFLLQVAGVYDDDHSDGYVKLYSREIIGKDAAKSGYIPVLAFGKRPSSVTVQTTDGNVTALSLVSPEAQSGDFSYTAAVECDSSLTFTVTVEANHYPYVTVNGALFTGSITPTGTQDEYSITVEQIKRSASVEVTAIVPVNITLHAPKGGVQTLSPAGFPVGGAGAKVPKDQPFELKLKVREGFRFDSAKVVGIANTADSVKLTPVISGDTVTLTLDNAGADTAIILFTDTLKRSVTVATQGEAGVFENLNDLYEVTHFSTAKITFNLAAGYHLPLAWVNGSYLPVTGEGGLYTLSIPNVRADRSVTLWAYPDTVVPVTEDTYISGRSQNININYAKDTLIAVQRSDYSFPTYMNRAYLQFDIPNSIRSGGYNYATLQLYIEQADNSKGNPNKVEVRTATMPTDVNLSTLTWSNSENTIVAPTGTSLAQSGNIPVATTNTPLALDVSDYLLGNTAPTTSLLQVVGVYNYVGDVLTYSDGYLYFYSKDNLAAQGIPRPEYIPVLVFGKRPSRVTVTAGDSVTLAPGETAAKDILSGETYTLSFTASSYLPSVTLTPAKPHTLTADAGGVWTLTIPDVLRPLAASIELKRIVEITKGANVTVLNSKLTDTIGLKATHEANFTLTAGYIPAVTQNGKSISLPYSSTNIYSVRSTEVVPKTVIDIAAVKPKLNIVLGAGMGSAIIVDGGDGEREVSAGSYALGFTLADGYTSPVAHIGGHELIPQEVSTPSSYTLTIGITRDTTLTLTAAVERRVSVLGEHFTVTSPSKKPNADYYAAGENSAWVMTFTLDAGYELAGAYVGQTPVTPALSGSTYTLTVDNVTGDTTVTISARLLRFRVAIDAGEDVAIIPSSFSTAEPNVDSVDYGANYVLTFTVSEKHLPQVTVDSATYPLGEPIDGVYTVSISSVTEDKAITLATLPPYTVTVQADGNISGLAPAGATHTVARGDTLTLTFTVTAGYTVTLAPESLSSGLSREEDSYTLILPNITGDVTVGIAATPPTPATGVASNEQNDPVVATRYYTLLGQEIREPAITGIYIVKEIFASGKTIATKRLFYKIK